MPERKLIALEVERVARSIISAPIFLEMRRQKSWGVATSLIKHAFGELGKSLGYEVFASNYQNANGGEWLYDLVWSRSENVFLKSIDLVMETELKPGGSVANAANVDDDFLKLVQARAFIRVWRVLIPNPELAALHIANCKQQIEVFDGSLVGDIYIFIVGVWSNESDIFEKYEFNGIRCV
jgi:hypothetical protein